MKVYIVKLDWSTDDTNDVEIIVCSTYKKANEKFKELRQSKLPPLTQTDLANVLGMTQRKISFLETGATEPSLRDLKAICMYFQVSADYLLDLPNTLERK